MLFILSKKRFLTSFSFTDYLILVTFNKANAVREYKQRIKPRHFQTALDK